MPSRREIREAAVQFLYWADAENAAPPAELRDLFWQFITGTSQRKLLAASAKLLDHLNTQRAARVGELEARATAARPFLQAHDDGEAIGSALESILTLEQRWSNALTQLHRLQHHDLADEAAASMRHALEQIYQIDRSLAAMRQRLLELIEQGGHLPQWLNELAASLRRLQRLSERVRMVEAPQEFPDQSDVAHLRESQAELAELRSAAEGLGDAVLAARAALDAELEAVIENYAPGRVDPVDRAILRLAAHEIRSGSQPAPVAINEAIELAKRFGSSDSGRFVNGVLDKVARRAQA